MASTRKTRVPSPGAATAGAQFRSGAVARMANMPVATLRIWEQRYNAVRPTMSASGHRLYGAADVERVLLLRRLTALGHAIGSIAALDTEQLKQLSLPGMEQAPGSRLPAAAGRAASALRVVVAGPALLSRLRRPALAERLARPIAVAEILPGEEPLPATLQADILVWHAAELQPEVPDWLQAIHRAGGVRRVAVLYRYASTLAIQRFTHAGAALIREPADDDVLALWLGALESRPPAAAVVPPAPALNRRASADTSGPRRYDDATLTAIAGLSSTLACECPRHVAELLMQLSSFEAYSASCMARNPADAQLHAYLQQVAGASRALFESALEQLASHEGLPLR